MTVQRLAGVGAGIPLGLATLSLALACSEPGKPGGTGGGPVGRLELDAGPDDGFVTLSLAASNGEGELFFSQALAAGGYQFLLQHLDPEGAGLGAMTAVANGLPKGPPHVAVSSNGSEVACCWEDFGLNPNTASVEIAGLIVRCNSVPVGGMATDDAMDGGFVDLGYLPVTARSGNSTIVAYSQTGNRGVYQELLYEPWGFNIEFAAPFLVLGWQVAPADGGFTIVMGDGGALGYGTERLNLGDNSPMQGVPNGASSGGFAVAAIPPLTAVLMHQGTSVVASLIGGPATAPIPISAATEVPLDPVAAVTCDPQTFGFAYAIDGGGVSFRSMGSHGTPGAPSAVATGFAAGVTTLAMAAVDGGVLIAAGNASQIALFTAPCP